MSGLEIVIVVGGAIYITKKVRERREKKKLLERGGVSELGPNHGRAEIVETPTRNSQNSRLRQQVPAEEVEPLPLYRAPTAAPPNNATDMRWSNSIHLPTYDELSEDQLGKEVTVDGEKGQDDDGLLRADSSQASSSMSTPLATPMSPASTRTSYLAPPLANWLPKDTSEKKRKFWRRSSSSKTPVV